MVSLGGGVVPSGTASRPSPCTHKNREKMVVFFSKSQNALFTCKNRVHPKNRTIFSSGLELLFVEASISKKKSVPHNPDAPLCVRKIRVFQGQGPTKVYVTFPKIGPKVCDTFSIFRAKVCANEEVTLKKI